MKVGDQITCVNIRPLEGNDVAPPLVDGKTYPLLQIIKDSAGNEHFDVGLESKYNYIRSYETKEELPTADKIHWCHPSRFVIK